MFPLSSERHFAAVPDEPGPRKPVANFIAGVRARYNEKKQKPSPNEKKFRPSPIWYFLATISLVVLIQNLLVNPHVEIISYSQFKSLVKKDLIHNLTIRETVIAGSLKGAAAREILPRIN